MQEVNTVKVHAWECFFNRESETFIYALEHLWSDFSAMVICCVGKDLDHRFKIDEVLSIHHLQLFIKLKYLAFESIQLNLFIHDLSPRWNLGASRLRQTSQQIVQELTVTLRRWIISCLIRQGVLTKECNDLLSISTTKTFSSAEFVRDFIIACTIIARQFSEHTIAEVDIDHFVVFSSREQVIAGVVSGSCRNFTWLLSSTSWSLTLYFSNFVPLSFSIAPHVCICNTIFLEYLHISVRLSGNSTFNLSLEVRNFRQVNLLSAWLGSSFTFLIVLGKVWAIILSDCISCESSYFLVLASYDNVAPHVVRHRPNCLRKLNLLFAVAVSPQSDCAIITACHDLTSWQAVNAENEAGVASEIHHVCSIH